MTDIPARLPTTWTRKGKDHWPKIAHVAFTEFTLDDDSRIVTDAGTIWFRNGWGAHIRRHFHYTDRQRVFEHYSVRIDTVDDDGKITPAKYNPVRYLGFAERIAEDRRLMIQNIGMVNPFYVTDRQRSIDAINLFLRQMMFLPQHTMSPLREDFKNAKQQRNLDLGLPEKMNPKKRQLKLRVTRRQPKIRP